MPKKYHINPENGNVGVCHAEHKCRFAVDGVEPEHYTTATKARQAYEAQQEENSDDTPLTKKEPESDSVVERVGEGDGETVYMFPANAMDKVDAAIDKANRRLERAGIEERFDYTTETIYEDDPDVKGLSREKIKLTLNTPAISYNGVTFLAAVDKEEAGMMVRTARGVDISGFTPETQVCDHCGKKRSRNTTYLVQEADGTRKQVGKSCLQNYLGVKPEGLWALSYGDDDLKVSRSSFGGEALRYDSRHAIAVALAVSNNGEDFRGTSSDNSTSSAVSQYYRPPQYIKGNEKEAAEYDAWRAKVDSRVDALMKDGTEIDNVVATFDNDDSTDNTWKNNVRVLTHSEKVNPRSLSTLVSSVSVNKKKKEYAPKETYTPGFFGSTGEKFTQKKATVVSNKLIWGTNYQTGEPELRSQVVMKDEDGHQLLLWGSRVMGVKDGEEITMSSGKVKSHNNYRGEDQTVVNYVRFANEDKDYALKLAQEHDE